jgi:drug/metabolite transporter (DMT)-like permease
MICGSFFSALMGQITHLLRDDVDWRIIALIRCGLALVFSVGLAKSSGAKLVFRGSVALWVRGCASSISLLCSFYALTRLAPSEVMTLTNTLPIWVAFLSWPVLRCRPTLSVWLAAVCGVLGVVLIQSRHFESGPNSATASWAIALSLTAAFTSAIAMLGLHRVKDIHPWAIVVHYSGVATLFVLGTWAVGALPDLSPLNHGQNLLMLLGVGVTATLGQLCVTRAFTLGQPDRVSVAGLSQVVFALGLGLIFEVSDVTRVTLAGIALILAPTAWVMAGGRGRPAVSSTSLPTRDVSRRRITFFSGVGVVSNSLPATTTKNN